MTKLALVMVAASVALIAGTSMAQRGPGGGAGPGPGMQGAGTTASAPGMGMGPGMRAGRGPAARYGQDFTPGWTMMNAQERRDHQERMRSMKTYDECKTYAQQHHDQMVARAKEKGGKPVGQPRRDACGPLKR